MIKNLKNILTQITLAIILATTTTNQALSMEKQTDKETDKQTTKNQVTSSKKIKSIKDLTPEELNQVDENGENMLFKCYSECRILDAIKLKKRGATGNINSTNNLGQKPLFVAYLYGNLEGAERLQHAKYYGDDAEAECDIEMLDDLGKPKIFKTIDMQDDNGQTPVFVLYSYGFIDRAIKLIENGATSNIDSQDFNGKTPIFCAYMRGDFKTVDKLLKNDAKGDIDMRDNMGKTPLMEACEIGDINAVKELISHGANIHTQDSINQTAMFFAYTAGKCELIDLLIENDAKKININATNAIGQTPLFLAFSRGDIDAVKELKKRGAKNIVAPNKKFNKNTNNNYNNKKEINLNDSDEICQSPIFVAYSQGNLEAVKKLKNAKFYFNDKNIINAIGHVSMKTIAGKTPLSKTFLDGNIKAIKILLENGAINIINTPDSASHTPLFYAYGYGRMEIAKGLKKLGAIGDIYMKNKKGQTPLFLAVFNDNIEAVKRLQEICPNWYEYVNQLDTDGNRPINIAYDHGLTRIAEYLLFTGSKHPLEKVFDPNNDEELKNKMREIIRFGANAHSNMLLELKEKRGESKEEEINGKKITLQEIIITETKEEQAKEESDLPDEFVTPKVNSAPKVNNLPEVKNGTINKSQEKDVQEKNKKKKKKKHKNKK